MKLRKNTGVKASIVAAAVALFAGLLTLIHANPQVHVEASAAPAVTPQVQPAPDYGGFFRGERDGRDDDDRFQQRTQSQVPSTSVQPHTRTRGS
ncbi:MAG TPA: hypothetical protein VFY10_08340 [Dehalococcoidia bacterium]|nr:hypothetical protein [Dehalococcoidia bacterium]